MLLLLWLPLSTHGYSGGAGREACSSLEPGHGAAPQPPADTPYTLSVRPRGGVSVGGNLSVSLAGTGWLLGAEYKGFLLQARDRKTGGLVGSWAGAGPGTRYLHCSNPQATDCSTHFRSVFISNAPFAQQTLVSNDVTARPTGQFDPQ